MSVDRGGMCFLEIGALHAVAEKKKLVNGATRFTLFQMVAKRNHSASDRLNYLISLRMPGFSLSRHLLTHFDLCRYLSESSPRLFGTSSQPNSLRICLSFLRHLDLVGPKLLGGMPSSRLIWRYFLVAGAR